MSNRQQYRLYILLGKKSFSEINERKREPYILPHEIIQDVEKVNSTEIWMRIFITKMSASFTDFSFKKSSNVVCQGCGQTYRSGQESLIIIDPLK